MNRLVRPVSFAFEPDLVKIYAMAQFGAAGAPTLNTNNSKGVCQWASSTQVWKATTASTTSVTAAESLYGVFNGMSVTGSGIPANTTVSAVNPTAGTFTLSNAATTSLSQTPLTFSGGQYIITFGSQFTPFKRLDNYVKLLQLTYDWDNAPNSKLLTGSVPAVPAAPFVWLLSNQTALGNQTFTGTGTTATSTAVSAVSNPGQIVPGMLVSGSGVAAETYVESVNVSAATLVLSAATSTSVSNTVLTYTPINPSSLIIQCGYYTSTFTGTALGNHAHDFLVKGGQAASTTNDVAMYAGPLIGKQEAADATVVGGSATNGGVQNASAGTPAGTISTPTFVAANPASGEILRLGFDMSRSNAI